MKKNNLFIFLIIVFSVVQAMVLNGCANIIPPTGGLKDSLPPVLLVSLPKDSTLNFNANKITLTFDEYVLLDDNVSQDLIVSPNPETMPVVEAKLKNVTIKLKDSLKPNTTYSINFGNSLKDVNEGNKLKNFTYVFSTGGTLSTGTLRGNVKLAETGATDSTLIVLLYSNLNDSAVKKTKPDYYTRLDSSGNFRFRFLPAETFAVYVVPNDYSKRYDDSTKLFAFYNTPVKVSDNPDSIKLYAYEQEKPKEKNKVAATAPDNKKDKKAEDKRLKITNNLESNEQDILEDLELTLSRRIVIFDTARIILTDTNYKPLKGYTWLADTAFQKYSLHFKWQENEPYKLIIGKEAFADTAGINLSKSDTVSFKTKRESQYGSIKLHFNNLDHSRNPVLLLVQGDKIIKSVALISTEWNEKLFKPGDYEIRVLYDTNKNLVWDAGNFDTKLQPETVQRIPRKLVIKPNWDNEVDINL